MNPNDSLTVVVKVDTIGRPSPMTPWATSAMGYKTRNKHKSSNKYIIRRRNG